MERIGRVVLVAGMLIGCGSSTNTGTTGDLTVTLGTLPAAVGANADSAFVRVRNTALGVNEVRRVGLASSAVTVTVTAGDGYEVSAVTLISGATNFAIGGGMVAGVTVEADGMAATTVPIDHWTADPVEIPAGLVANQVAAVSAMLNGSQIRAITDGAPVGINLIFAPPPTSDDYFQGGVDDRFFTPSAGDSVPFNITVPATGIPTEMWMQVRWSASNTNTNWTTGFPFDISLPTIAVGDTLWWIPVVP